MCKIVITPIYTELQDTAYIKGKVVHQLLHNTCCIRSLWTQLWKVILVHHRQKKSKTASLTESANLHLILIIYRKRISQNILLDTVSALSNIIVSERNPGSHSNQIGTSYGIEIQWNKLPIPAHSLQAEEARHFSIWTTSCTKKTA